MDLNISKYVVFHGDFESAVQMSPYIAQISIFIQFWIVFWRKITKMAQNRRKSMPIGEDGSPDQKITCFKGRKLWKRPQKSKMSPKTPSLLSPDGGWMVNWFLKKEKTWGSADWAEPIRWPLAWACPAFRLYFGESDPPPFLKKINDTIHPPSGDKSEGVKKKEVVFFFSIFNIGFGIYR